VNTMRAKSLFSVPMPETLGNRATWHAREIHKINKVVEPKRPSVPECQVAGVSWHTRASWLLHPCQHIAPTNADEIFNAMGDGERGIWMSFARHKFRSVFRGMSSASTGRLSTDFKRLTAWFALGRPAPDDVQQCVEQWLAFKRSASA
jgi:hypothetical protein